MWKQCIDNWQGRRVGLLTSRQSSNLTSGALCFSNSWVFYKTIKVLILTGVPISELIRGQVQSFRENPNR